MRNFALFAHPTDTNSNLKKDGYSRQQVFR